MADFLQHFVDAVSAGSTYALLGLGLTLVFSVMNLVNFAYGTLIVYGGYAMVVSLDAGAPYVVAVLVAVVVVTVLSWLMGVVAFRPFRNSPPSTLLLSSFGVALTLQAIVSSIFGDTARNVASPSWFGRSWDINGVVVNWLQIISVAVTVVLLIGLTVVLQRTTLGLHIRAAAEDADVARLLGVRATRVVSTVFVISGVIAAIVAVLWLAKVGTVSPRSDLNPTLKAFIVVVIGGLGTARGAVVGGLLLGLFESFLIAYVPDSLTSYETTGVFVILMVLLLVRPQGVLGRPLEVSK